MGFSIHFSTASLEDVLTPAGSQCDAYLLKHVQSFRLIPLIDVAVFYERVILCSDTCEL